MSEISVSFNRGQAAAYCGCAVQQIDQWLRRSENPLPAIRLKRRVIILRSSLDAWLHAEEARQLEGVIDS